MEIDLNEINAGADQELTKYEEMNDDTNPA